MVFLGTRFGSLLVLFWKQYFKDFNSDVSLLMCLCLHMICPHWHLSLSPGRRRFLCVWWETNRTCVMPDRSARTRAAAWLRRTAVTSRRCPLPRATRTSPTSSPNSSDRWWSTSSTEQTAGATAAPSPWPSSSTMCLGRGGSLCDVPVRSAGRTGITASGAQLKETGPEVWNCFSLSVWTVMSRSHWEQNKRTVGRIWWGQNLQTNICLFHIFGFLLLWFRPQHFSLLWVYRDI